VITSPPYLNRYDYSRTYALELCLLSVNSHQDMVRVRHSLLRSHIESREHTGKQITLPALDEILAGLDRQQLNNQRMPIMVRGYFEDMNLVISNLGKSVKPGGRVALVVANAQFAGESVPTDLLLSELAANHGFTTEEIWRHPLQRQQLPADGDLWPPACARIHRLLAKRSLIQVQEVCFSS
jgi:hypothetical protein